MASGEFLSPSLAEKGAVLAISLFTIPSAVDVSIGADGGGSGQPHNGYSGGCFDNLMRLSLLSGKGDGASFSDSTESAELDDWLTADQGNRYLQVAHLAYTSVVLVA